MPVPDVDVAVTDNKVEAHPDGGNRRGKTGDKIKWKKLDEGKPFEFRLVFRKQNPSDPGPDWPFEEPDDPPGSGSTGWVRKFTGTVSVEAGAFKYDIVVSGSATLDPMVIVGRI